MKKYLTLAVVAMVCAGTAKAQFAGEYNLGRHEGDYKSYNRVGISYNNDSYGFNSDAKYWFESNDMGGSLNGFGLNYIHGFSLSSSLPMFLEVGGNVNFNFGNVLHVEGESYYDDVRYNAKNQLQMIDLQVPVNYVYRFNVADDFSIAPYVGLNFKLNLIGKVMYIEEIWDDDEYQKEEDGWFNLYNKDDMDDMGTWNRFQMGWHVGVGFQYSKFYFGVQYGTDFIPAFSCSDEGYKPKVNTGSLKINLGYTF
ncbi:MAG: outer membrane beta-barrel protein [Muribaculaceae bacterium]|nr:outer membrane beta-barrel protein [Muribaculaceae bacterium]